MQSVIQPCVSRYNMKLSLCTFISLTYIMLSFCFQSVPAFFLHDTVYYTTTLHLNDHCVIKTEVYASIMLLLFNTVILKIMLD